MSNIQDAVPDYDAKADLPAAATQIAEWVEQQTNAVIDRANTIVDQVEPTSLKRYAVSAATAAAWTQGA